MTNSIIRKINAVFKPNSKKAKWWAERYDDLIKLTNLEFTKKHNIGCSYIIGIRKKLGIKNIRKLRSKKDYSYLDWTKQDIELAEFTGLTRERIRQIRKSRKLPLAVNYRRDRTAIKLYDFVLSIQDEARRLRITIQEISKILKITPIRSLPVMNYPINWKLPNRYINRIWGFYDHYASMFRYRHKIESSDELANHREAIEAEELKVVKWFNDREALLKRIKEMAKNNGRQSNPTNSQGAS